MSIKKDTVNENNNYDAIVIGSGLGGLSCASLLTIVNKKRVLVLEKHFEAGGLTHEFKRGPYSWDVGLHYVGNMTKRFLDRICAKVFDLTTNGDLKWNNMPEVFDILSFADSKIPVKETVRGFKQCLYKQFPNDKKSINKYFTDAQIGRIWYLSYFFSNFLRGPLKWPFDVIKLILKKYSEITTSEYMNKHIKNPRLQAALTARWGNYGIPPSRSSFAAHTVTEHHYFNGAVFPKGGSEKIAISLEKTIEKRGGKILLNREVTEILLNDKTAYGVRAKNINNPTEITEFFAPIIISAIGAKNTYLKILPESLNLPIQTQLKNHDNGYSGINIYLGLKESPAKLGIKGENYWIADTDDINAFGESFKMALEGTACYCFVSFPSLKCGVNKKIHTADIVSIMPYDFFAKWKTGTWKERELEYYEVKEKITAGILKLVEKHIPGFNDLIAYKEVATPLTFEHFSNTMSGAFYGLPETPNRYKIKDLKVKTPIKNLYLTGTDIISNGIVPALMSGMGTVSYLNGCFGIIKVMSKVFAFKPKQKETFMVQFNENELVTEDKWFGQLIEKTKEGNNIYRLTFQFETELQFIGGQHIKLFVGEDEWRAYSVAKIEQNKLTLIIDIRPDGVGANYAKNIEIGHKAYFRMPITDLVYHPSDRDAVFIATGTGLIPFLHMMDELKKNNIKKKITVIFGCMNENDLFVDKLVEPYKTFFDVNTVIVVENPQSDKYFKGRVTDYLSQKMPSPTETDFYICGHPHMTDSTVKFLREKGSDRVYY